MEHAGDVVLSEATAPRAGPLQHRDSRHYPVVTKPSGKLRYPDGIKSRSDSERTSLATGPHQSSNLFSAREEGGRGKVGQE